MSACSKRNKYKYRAIMERHLGRKLIKGEEVHHINGDHTDNRVENLRVYRNKKEHKRAHNTEQHTLFYNPTKDIQDIIIDC